MHYKLAANRMGGEFPALLQDETRMHSLKRLDRRLATVKCRVITELLKTGACVQVFLAASLTDTCPLPALPQWTSTRCAP